MANEIQYFGDPSADSGLTVIARIYNSAGTQVGGDVSCTESGSLAIYIGNMVATSAGAYGVRFSQAGILLGHGTIYWDGSAEVDSQTLNTILGTKSSQASVDTVDGIVDTILVDTNELQTNQGAWATATGFATPTNVSDAQTAIISEVNANEAKIDIIDTNVDSILVDTAELQTNQSGWLTATGFATPTNITDSQTAIIAEINNNEAKIDIIDSNVDAILVDTSELQVNQGSWATATGFSTPSNVSDAQTAIISQIDANETKIDIIDSNVDAVKTKTDQLNFTGTDVQSVASNMRGTDGANTIAPDNASITSILADTNELQSNQDNWLTADISTLVDDVWGRVIDGGYTAEELLRIISAVMAGKSTITSTSATFRDVGDTTNRVVGAVDSEGSRTSVTINEL